MQLFFLIFKRYFSQILEEHGPMEINNKLLVGEYEHFPEEARKIVEDEGGLKSFLLKSFHFIMVDNLVGLRKHAVLLKEDTNRNETSDNEGENYKVCDRQENSSQNKLQLNPAAKEFIPLSYPKKPYLSTSTDLAVASYETQQHLPWCSPASCKSLHSLQGHGIDTIEDESSFSEILLNCFGSENPNILLPWTSWHCQYRGVSPAPSQMPLLSSVAKQPSYIYADGVSHQDKDEESANSDRKYHFVPTEIQTYEDPQCQLKNSNSTVYEDSCNSTNEAECDIQVIKTEKKSRGIPLMKSNPHARMIAVQVRN